MKSYQKYLLILLTISLSYVGCKEKQLTEMPARQRAYLHFVNFNAALNGVGVDFNVTSFETKGNLFENLTYPQTWPQSGYASLLTLQDDAKDTGWIYFNLRKHTTGDTIIRDTQLNLASGLVTSSYSMILLDKGGTSELLKTVDNFDEATDSTGNIRYMNFNPVVPSTTMVSADSSYGKPTVAISNLGYKSYTGFKAFKKGKHTLYFIDNSTKDTIATFPNFDIKLKKNYAFYLIFDTTLPTPGPRVIMEEMNR